MMLPPSGGATPRCLLQKIPERDRRSEALPYTQADLDELDEKIKTASLVKSTAFADQSTEFRSIDELLKLRATMAQEISANSRVRLAGFSKGTSC